MEVKTLEIPVIIKRARIKKVICEAELSIGSFERVVEREFDVDIPI